MDLKLEGKESIKLLGITIDRQLTFKNHINNICDTAQNRLFALLRIRKYLNINQAKTLANSFIFSYRVCHKEVTLFDLILQADEKKI